MSDERLANRHKRRVSLKRLAASIAHCLSLTYLLLALPAYAAPTEPPAAVNPAYVYQLSYPDAEAAIGEALRQKGAGDKVSAVIYGRGNEPIYSYAKPMTVQIRGLRFDKELHRWSASLMFVADGEVITAIPASGHYDEMVEVPVLKREVRNGDVINARDIELRDFPVMHTRSDTVTDLAALIGKSPVHGISPQRPIRENEIESPAIVKKNGIVQMRFDSPGMQISATGQAMTDGAKGDVIEVKNTASRKIVRAVVADADTVDILVPGMETSQLTGGAHAAN